MTDVVQAVAVSSSVSISVPSRDGYARSVSLPKPTVALREHPLTITDSQLFLGRFGAAVCTFEKWRQKQQERRICEKPRIHQDYGDRPRRKGEKGDRRDLHQEFVTYQGGVPRRKGRKGTGVIFIKSSLHIKRHDEKVVCMPAKVMQSFIMKEKRKELEKRRSAVDCSFMLGFACSMLPFAVPRPGAYSGCFAVPGNPLSTLHQNWRHSLPTQLIDRRRPTLKTHLLLCDPYFHVTPCSHTSQSIHSATISADTESTSQLIPTGGQREIQHNRESVDLHIETTTAMPPTRFPSFDSLELHSYVHDATMAPRAISKSEYDRLTTETAEAQTRINGVIKGVCSKLPSELRLKILEAYLHSHDMALFTMWPGAARLYIPDSFGIRRNVQADGSIDFPGMCSAMAGFLMKRLKDQAYMSSMAEESPAQVQAVLQEMDIECAKMLPKHTIHQFAATFPTRAQPTRTPIPRKLRHCTDKIFHINLKITLQQTFQALYPVDLYAAINGIAHIKQHFPSLISLRVMLCDLGSSYYGVQGATRSLFRSGYMSPNCQNRYTTIEEEMERLVVEMHKIPGIKRSIVWYESEDAQAARQEARAQQSDLTGLMVAKGEQSQEMTAAKVVDRAIHAAPSAPKRDQLRSPGEILTGQGFIGRATAYERKYYRYHLKQACYNCLASRVTTSSLIHTRRIVPPRSLPSPLSSQQIIHLRLEPRFQQPRATSKVATMPPIRTPNFEFAKQALGLEVKQPPLSPDETHHIKALVGCKRIVDEHMATARALEVEYLEKLNLVSPRTTLRLFAEWLANIATYINRNGDASLLEQHILREVANLRIAAEQTQPFENRKSPCITIGAPVQWKTVIRGPVIGGRLSSALVEWMFKRTRLYLPHLAMECFIHRTVFEMAVETEGALLGMLEEAEEAEEAEEVQWNSSLREREMRWRWSWDRANEVDIDCRYYTNHIHPQLTLALQSIIHFQWTAMTLRKFHPPEARICGSMYCALPSLYIYATIDYCTKTLSSIAYLQRDFHHESFPTRPWSDPNHVDKVLRSRHGFHQRQFLLRLKNWLSTGIHSDIEHMLSFGHLTGKAPTPDFGPFQQTCLIGIKTLTPSIPRSKLRSGFSSHAEHCNHRTYFGHLSQHRALPSGIPDMKRYIQTTLFHAAPDAQGLYYTAQQDFISDGSRCAFRPFKVNTCINRRWKSQYDTTTLTAHSFGENEGHSTKYRASCDDYKFIASGTLDDTADLGVCISKNAMSCFQLPLESHTTFCAAHDTPSFFVKDRRAHQGHAEKLDPSIRPAMSMTASSTPVKLGRMTRPTSRLEPDCLRGLPVDRCCRSLSQLWQLQVASTMRFLMIYRTGKNKCGIPAQPRAIHFSAAHDAETLVITFSQSFVLFLPPVGLGKPVTCADLYFTGILRTFHSLSPASVVLIRYTDHCLHSKALNTYYTDQRQPTASFQEPQRKNQPIIAQFKNSAEELRQRADELVNKYRLLEGQYAALPLHRRRNLKAGTSWETFCAAAIFEGRISQYCREEDGSFDILQTLVKQSRDFRQEMFPVAIPWFSDLAAVYQRAHDEARSWTTYTLNQEQVGLAKLKWKYEQASKLLGHLNHAPTTAAETSSRGMECFAQACKSISSGMQEHAALKAAEDEMERFSYDDDHFMATEGVREWFSIDLRMPAWPSADPPPDFTRWQQGGVPASQPGVASGSSTSTPRMFDFSQASQSSSSKAGGIWSERTSGLNGSQQNGTTAGGWWDKNNPQSSPQAQMPPPPRPAPKVDHKSRLAEYDAHWKSLAPHDKQFPCPNSTFSMPSFQNRQELPYNQQKVAQWSPATVIGVMTKRFFTDAFAIRTTLITFSDDPTSVDFELQKKNSATTVVALRKTLKMESVKWHPDRLNRRTGVPGQIDESIGKAPGNVAIRSAVQELIEQCDKFVHGAKDWNPDETMGS
ncbi:uncharacterized protein MYCFIDRAFT_177489 [Pseudocercospora fijiensis CIRAD86]|uniref:Uncharacterized protein n=1 Tax=Pseudocercospora fijiensis (strain CIRAD86) TaxID=383855 RepID=M3ASS5_PSEFD|nr:uncharacterized protein MYCFIDRAFT_177489 [Pseudocercospora fijiensis CIRAD86]EME80547.1 hypothetical protein MYCFIDRAFT_177489 [Pseudocercospora fijiensis CIRAD86]